MPHIKSESYGAKYMTFRRFASYNAQLEEVLGQNPDTVLEIGSHLGIVTKCMRTCDIQVTTMDINSDWKPDVIGSVLEMPLADNAYDLVLCCEVLEHIPLSNSPGLCLKSGGFVKKVRSFHCLITGVTTASPGSYRALSACIGKSKFPISSIISMSMTATIIGRSASVDIRSAASSGKWKKLVLSC